jgi:hypothetical protein
VKQREVGVSVECAQAEFERIQDAKPDWVKAPSGPEPVPRHPDVHNGVRESISDRRLSFGGSLKSAR